MSKFFKHRNLSSELNEEVIRKDLKGQNSKGIDDYTASTKFLASTPLSSYNEHFGPNLVTGDKFFRKPKASKSPKIRKSYRTVQISKTPHASEDLRQSTSTYWEINERIESCEIRYKQLPDASVNDKVSLWSNCCKEIVQIVHKNDQNFASCINRLTKGLFAMVNDGIQELKANVSAKNLEVKNMSEEIKHLNKFVLKIETEIQEYKSQKLNEDLLINNELEEIFGNDEQKILELKYNAQKLLETKPTGIIGILKEVYESLSKERFIPNGRNLDIDVPDPDDITMALKYNYHLILQSTTKKVMNLLNKNPSKKTVYTQTQSAYISTQEFEDLSKKLEKNSIMLHSAHMQIERLKEDISVKKNLIEKSEQEKVFLNNEILRVKREGDTNVKELALVRRTLDMVNRDKVTLSRDLENKVKELNNAQEKIEYYARKIKKFARFINKDSELDLSDKELLDQSPVENGNGKNFYGYRQYPKVSPRGTLLGNNSRRETQESPIEPALDPKKLMSKNYPSNKLGPSKNPIDDTLLENYFKSDQKTLENEKVPNLILTSLDLADQSHPQDVNLLSLSIKNKKNSIKPLPNSTVKSKAKNKSKNRPESKNAETNSELSDKPNKKKIKFSAKETIESIQNNNNDSIIEREVFRDGKYIKYIDRGTNASYDVKAVISIGVQFGSDYNQNNQSNKEKDWNLHMMHFNPNNVYGLRGDVFYNSRANIFSAQPRISETEKSI